jgi:sigma-B regulation protein RsbU (phosphoserine phosphatase)
MIPERFKTEYRNELRRIFDQRINLFCYIVISAFFVEIVLASFWFRRLLSAKDIPGVAGGTVLAAIILFSGKIRVTRGLFIHKLRGFFFSIFLVSIAILAAAAHPDVIANLGITLVLIALFVSVLLLPWNVPETAVLGVYTLVSFIGVYEMSNAYVNYEIFGINITLLVTATIICMVVKKSEEVMRQKDFVLKKEIEEKSRIMIKELEIANKIHSGLMPKSVKTDLVDIAVDYKPMLYMGGDYARFHFMEKDLLAFMIADITGHGVSAALLVNRLHTEIEELLRIKLAPGEMLKRLDGFIKSDFGKMSIFLSAFGGLLNFRERKLVYSNFGHPPQILFRKSDNKIIYMESQTFLMGIGMDDNRVYQMSLDFDKGDKIFLFTDGIIDARNTAGEQYGNKRFEDFVKENGSLDVMTFNEKLMSALDDFQGGKQGDDIFLLSIQIK